MKITPEMIAATWPHFGPGDRYAVSGNILKIQWRGMPISNTLEIRGVGDDNVLIWTAGFHDQFEGTPAFRSL